MNVFGLILAYRRYTLRNKAAFNVGYGITLSKLAFIDR